MERSQGANIVSPKTIQCGPPVYDSKVGAKNYNFTMVHGTEIAIVFVWFIKIITFGGPTLYESRLSSTMTHTMAQWLTNHW